MTEKTPEDYASSYTLKEMMGMTLHRLDKLDEWRSTHQSASDIAVEKLSAVESVTMRLRGKIENGGNGIEHQITKIQAERDYGRWALTLAIPSALTLATAILTKLTGVW